MTRFTAKFMTTICLDVDVEADDEDSAAEDAWELASEYLATVVGDHRSVSAEASLDGIGAETVEERSA